MTTDPNFGSARDHAAEQAAACPFTAAAPDVANAVVDCRGDVRRIILWQVCLHESGHATIAKLTGQSVGGALARLTPTGYTGRVWGEAGNACNLVEKSAERLSLCSRLADVMPQPGEARNDCASIFLISHDRMVELLGGIAAERVLCDNAPLDGSSLDQQEAAAFAAIGCAPAAVEAYLVYAMTQAMALIEANKSVVLAIAAALFEREELSGEEIDGIIAATIARDRLKAEQERRSRWAATMASAAAFKVTLGNSEEYNTQKR